MNHTRGRPIAISYAGRLGWTSGIISLDQGDLAIRRQRGVLARIFVIHRAGMRDRCVLVCDGFGGLLAPEPKRYSTVRLRFNGNATADPAR